MHDFLDWPRGLSSDIRMVSSLCLPAAPCRVRVLLPGLSDTTEMRWGPLALSAGVELDERTRFCDLSQVPNPDLAGVCPNGQVMSKTASRLVQALVDSTADSEVELVFWGVYAEQDAWGAFAASRIASVEEGLRWCDGSHLVSGVVDVRVLERFTFEQGLRFPVAVLPKARDYLIAATGYGDSLYVSGSEALCAGLEQAGLEYVEVSPNGVLPG